jgi:hypothetical protein
MAWTRGRRARIHRHRDSDAGSRPWRQRRDLTDAVLIRPLPFPNPERLVRIAADARATDGRTIGISQPQLQDLGERAGVFDGVTAIWPVSASLLGGDRPERVEVLVTRRRFRSTLVATEIATTRCASLALSSCIPK